MIRQALPILLWLLPLAVLLAGGALVLLGLRGRKVDNHPLCRRCGYDLIGNADSVRCPECGGDLNGRNAIVLGHRRRRRRPLIFGLLLATPAMITLTGVGVAVGRGIDLDRHKPIWLLMREGDMQSIAELNRRLSAGELDKQQVQRVVIQAIALQANRARPWVAGWGDFIETARTAGAVDDPQWSTYTRQAIDFKIEPRPRMHRSGPVIIRITPALDRAATRTRLTISWHTNAVSLAKVPLLRLWGPGEMRVSGFESSLAAQTQCFIGDPSVSDLPDGPTPLRIRLALTVRPGFQPNSAILHAIERQVSVMIVPSDEPIRDGGQTTTKAAP